MIKLWFLGPLLFGTWLTYKGLRDERVWLIIRCIWFLLGVGLLGLGALQGALIVAPILLVVIDG
jgi:hypothetical protein